MKINHRLGYWIEAVEAAFEDVGKENLLSKEDVTRMAETLQGSSEQEGMAFGDEHIPNPLQAKMQTLKSEYEQRIVVLEQRDFVFRKNVADRHGPYVSADDVYIEGGDVVYDHKGV